MDWAKQSEEIVKNWTETQKKLWDSFTTVLESSGGSLPMNDIWQQMIATWEENVGKTLATESEWTESWFNSLNKEGLPEQVLQWIAQGQTTSKQWQETQQKMWRGWFDMAKQANPTTLDEQFQAEGQKVFQTMQATAEKVMSTQMELLNMWLPTQNGTKSTKKTAAKK